MIVWNILLILFLLNFSEISGNVQICLVNLREVFIFSDRHYSETEVPDKCRGVIHVQYIIAFILQEWVFCYCVQHCDKWDQQLLSPEGELQLKTRPEVYSPVFIISQSIPWFQLISFNQLGSVNNFQSVSFSFSISAWTVSFIKSGLLRISTNITLRNFIVIDWNCEKVINNNHHINVTQI